MGGMAAYLSELERIVASDYACFRFG
jgi:hypothetical protein